MRIAATLGNYGHHILKGETWNDYSC